jgi:uncharacterized damage-inducible protein DinB
MMHENKKIAKLSRAVRQSTLKRLRHVPPGYENWKPSHDMLSFADIAHHLIESDRWLFRKLEDPSLQSMTASVGEAGECSRQDFLKLLEELENLGDLRASNIEGMDSTVLDAELFDDRFGGKVTVWWMIVRGNLDHETHHRSQIAVYMRLLKLIP